MEPMKPMRPMEPMKPMEFKKSTRWWPEELGEPNSSGSQNDLQYAYFSGKRRLLVRDGEQLSQYDTGEHEITGIAQSSDAKHARFSTRSGPIDVAQLRRI
jgi:hypothetical protein